jgi:hypothetical protein
MKQIVVPALAFVLSLATLPARAQSRDEARPRDLQRLQEDLANLDEDLQALEQRDPKADTFRKRADEIREETVYLKVKMRRHQKSGREGTGVLYDEVSDLRKSIADLREDIDRSFARQSGELRLREGSEVLVRLDEPLSSRTARREDRFEASVFRPVRAEGTIAIPAGTRIRGIVRDCEPAERGSKSGKLDLDFDALYLDRQRLDIRGRVMAVRQDDEDHIDTKEKAGIGAVLGGVVGGILGGKKGAIAGILIGGTGAVVATKGEEVDLPAGAILTVRLDRALVIPRR